MSDMISAKYLLFKEVQSKEGDAVDACEGVHGEEEEEDEVGPPVAPAQQLHHSLQGGWLVH